MTRTYDEQVKLGIDRTPPLNEHPVKFLQSCGLWFGEQRIPGQETVKKRTWGGYATEIVI
jgi:hypothetical protein